ncbi:putative UDP-galactose/UDP-N-acetylglucosamine transporter srf-3, partial [Opisthorchis viverrini]
MSCTSSWIKYGSLAFLTIQTTCLVLLMRVSRTTDGPRYLISTIVVCAEVSKLLACILMTLVGEKGNFHAAAKVIIDQVFVNYLDTLRVLIPAALYVIQNNLLYVAISHLNAVAYQILYQCKIFTTAFFMVTLLGRRLILTQWIALLLLFIGIILSQWDPDSKSTAPGKNDVSYSSTLIGFLALACASFSSGFAGVYFEKILKGTAPSVWIRNIQLALFGITIGLCGVHTYDREAVAMKGFFQGYTPIVWVIVLLQTCSGLGIAFVMKYADNILKGFAAGLSIILSSTVSYFVLHDFTPSLTTLVGAALVIGAMVLYGYVPQVRPHLQNRSEV